jgi:hypothetical protein
MSERLDPEEFSDREFAASEFAFSQLDANEQDKIKAAEALDSKLREEDGLEDYELRQNIIRGKIEGYEEVMDKVSGFIGIFLSGGQG